jgi:hypothetical protein
MLRPGVPSTGSGVMAGRAKERIQYPTANKEYPTEQVSVAASVSSWTTASSGGYKEHPWILDIPCWLLDIRRAQGGHDADMSV